VVVEEEQPSIQSLVQVVSPVAAVAVVAADYELYFPYQNQGVERWVQKSLREEVGMNLDGGIVVVVVVAAAAAAVVVVAESAGSAERQL
jgi:hypothetical protein